MLVDEQKENTALIVDAINTVPFFEYCYPFSGIDMIAPFGEKCNRNRSKCEKICCKIVMQKTNNFSEVHNMTGKQMRDNPLFMRNNFESCGKWGIPLVKKQTIPTDDIMLVACSDTRANDNEENKKKGVHFFVDDYRFNGIYDNPERSFSRYSQYSFLLTPDFSTYADMDLWRQLESVAKNRWVGAYWQSKGLTVIPTISWSTPRSFEFCFDGVEQNAVVAVSALGCRKSKLQFMRGYNVMLDKLLPKTVLCFGDPLAEMQGNVISVNYRDSRKVVR